MVERISKFLRLIKLPNRTADHDNKALNDSSNPMKAFVEALIVDNATEFA